MELDLNVNEDVIYEVRGTDDPIDGDHVRFATKQEALEYAEQFDNATVYMLVLEYNEFGDVGELVDEIQIKGPEVTAEINNEDHVDSCMGDLPEEERFNVEDIEVVEESLTEDVEEETATTDEQPVAETPEDNAPEKLIATIKAVGINLRTLHRNLTGGNWFTIHELVGDWYDQLDELEDKIVENLISLGSFDVKIDTDAIIEPKEFTEEEVLQLIRGMFDSLMNLSTATRQTIELPTSVAPVFDELENFLQVEGKYKLDHYFGEVKPETDTQDNLVDNETPADTDADQEDESEEDDDMSDEEFIEALEVAIKDAHAKKELKEETDSEE